MRIDTSQVALLSQHTASVTDSREEQLRYWIGDARQATVVQNRPTEAAPLDKTRLADRLELSPEVRELLAQAKPQIRAANLVTTKLPHGQAKDGSSKGEDKPPSQLDAKIIIAEGVIKTLTGVAIKIKRLDIGDQANGGEDAQATPAEAGANTQATTDSQQPQKAGWGLEYTYHAVHDEREQTSFAASGHVTTADGREIDFTLATEMARAYHSEESVGVRAGDAVVKDPLVLNFGGQVGALTEDKVQFDLNADGQAEAMPFAGPGSGFLVYDRDNDGTVDDGTELFGPTSGDGFAELAALDADGNQWIDEADPAYAQLKVWTRDGGSDAVSNLQQKQVGAIYVGSTATPFSVRNASNDALGQVQESGVFLYEDGRAGAVQRVDVKV